MYQGGKPPSSIADFICLQKEKTQCLQLSDFITLIQIAVISYGQFECIYSNLLSSHSVYVCPYSSQLQSTASEIVFNLVSNMIVYLALSFGYN